MMHGRGKSSPVIVAGKPANKADRNSVSAAESAERRAGAEGNVDQQNTYRAQNRVRVRQALDHIRQTIAVWTRGGNRMRESCKYGSVRGREVTRVPTASEGASSSRCSAALRRGRSRRARSSRRERGTSACSCPSRQTIRQRKGASWRSPRRWRNRAGLTAAMSASTFVGAGASPSAFVGTQRIWPRWRPTSSWLLPVQSQDRSCRRRARCPLCSCRSPSLSAPVSSKRLPGRAATLLVLCSMNMASGRNGWSFSRRSHRA
jgi:hypothetical protein